MEKVIKQIFKILLFGTDLEAWSLRERTKSITFDVLVYGLSNELVRRYTYPTNKGEFNIITPEGLLFDTPIWFEK